jgi:N utilization substance protein A
VVQELRGEKIDIVPWTQDQAEYVCRALSPAKVSKIIMDEDERAMEVIVPDDQLSLAIGKKGQNVRLASRLTGWRLDVKGEAEAEEEARNARASLVSVPGIGDVTAELLYQHGFKSAEELATSDVDTVAQVDGVTAEKATTIIAAAQKHVEQKRVEAEARAAADAAAAEAAAVEAAAAEAAAAEAAATEAAAAEAAGGEAASPESGGEGSDDDTATGAAGGPSEEGGA